MVKHRVLLVCLLSLLCEGVQRIFQRLEDVDLTVLARPTPEDLQSCLRRFLPRTIVIVGESETDAATHLISSILHDCTEIPVIWIDLESNVIRVYTSRTLPAGSQGLIDAIRQGDLGPDENQVRPTAFGGDYA